MAAAISSSAGNGADKTDLFDMTSVCEGQLFLTGCCIFLLNFQENSKSWTVCLDISAPQVIFPDDFKCLDPVLVVVDLGRILLTNSQGTI